MSAKPAQSLDELADRIAASRAAAPARPERRFRHALRGEEARTGRRGNGGPALDAPEPRTLRLGTAEVLHLGQLLWGDRHTSDLARLTGEDPGQVRRWRRGEGRGPDARAARWVREEALARIAELQAAVEALDAVRPPPPPPADPEPEPEAEVTLAPGVQPEDARWFLDGLARATGGKPTFVREVLSARRPPRGRHWTAEVIVFDGQTHTLDCDRGADLQGTAVAFAWTPGPLSRQPRILWSDDAGGWVRLPDWGRGTHPHPAPVAAEPEPARAAAARPVRDPRQLDIEDLLADAGLLGD